MFLQKSYERNLDKQQQPPLWSVWIEGEGGGVEQSRVDLVQNQLIFSLHYSTPLHSPSFPSPSKQAISLCEGKLLKDLTRDSHKPQSEQQRLQRAFGYKTLNTKGGTRGTLISHSLQSQNRGLGFPLYSGRSRFETLILNGLKLLFGPT